MEAKLTSKKGFYVGDICYVLSDEDYDNEWGKKHNYESGRYEIRGNSFEVDGTAYGDGSYYDDYGNEYGVDAGVIGIVPIELCLKAPSIKELNELGRYIEGTEATFESDDGIFNITVGETSLTINTRDDETDDDDENDYDECEDEDDDEY